MNKKPGIIYILILCIILANFSSFVSASSAGDFIIKDGVLVKYTGNGGNVVIPENLSITKIGDDAFNATGITSISIPVSVKSIGARAFELCDLITVTIPTSVTSIGDGAFGGCFELISVTIPDNLISIGRGVFTSTKIPNPILINKGTKLCYVPDIFESYTVPSSVKIICNGAFIMCYSLQSVVIPDSVTEIGDDAFSWCEGLTDVKIPNTISKIGNGVFSYTGLTTIELPESVTSIGDWAFSNTPLTTLRLPQNLNHIGNYAFFDCVNLMSIDLPDGLISIGDCAFRGCQGLESISMPGSVTQIGDDAFSGTDISEPIIADNGRMLCFVPDGLTSFKIPESVTKINGYAFSNSMDLISIVIPAGVTFIGERAFGWCHDLKSIYFYGDAPIFGSDIFSDYASYLSIYYLDGTKGYPQSIEGAFTEAFDGNLPVYFDVIGKKFGWARSAIETLTSKGVINGTGKGMYSPGRYVTRAQECKLLVKAFDLKSKGEPISFEDTQNSWAKKYIDIASSQGIISGYGDNKFKPDSPISREELCEMIIKALQAAGREITIDDADIVTQLSMFEDNNEISDWAKKSVAQATKAGLVLGYMKDGTKTFRPSVNGNRAEAAVIIKRAYDDLSVKSITLYQDKRLLI